MGHLSEVRMRLDRLELRVDRNSDSCARRDKNLSDVSERLRDQQHTLQDLATTQSEHTGQQRVIETVQTEQGVLLREHGTLLRRILEKLDQPAGEGLARN